MSRSRSRSGGSQHEENDSHLQMDVHMESDMAGLEPAKPKEEPSLADKLMLLPPGTAPPPLPSPTIPVSLLEMGGSSEEPIQEAKPPDVTRRKPRNLRECAILVRMNREMEEMEDGSTNNEESEEGVKRKPRHALVGAGPSIYRQGTGPFILQVRIPKTVQS